MTTEETVGAQDFSFFLNFPKMWFSASHFWKNIFQREDLLTFFWQPNVKGGQLLSVTMPLVMVNVNVGVVWHADHNSASTGRWQWAERFRVGGWIGHRTTNGLYSAVS